MKLSTFSRRFLNKKSGGWAAIAALLFLAAFLFIGMNIETNFLNEFDKDVYNFIIAFKSDLLTKYMSVITFLGSSGFIVLSIIFLLLLGWKKKLRFIRWIEIAAATAVSATMNEILKIMFHRVRPEVMRLTEATGFSFPSGHSMTGMVFYGMLAFILVSEMKTKWKYLYAMLLSLLIINIGISRIYLGVHYPSDVAGGFCFGAVILNLVYGYIRTLRNKN